MGVPKFFRYISERYPCLSEVVKEYQIPEFDNLYLDMNGIIHTCSHPDDGDPHFRISEEKIIQDIFHYIEVLFRMIKPRKLFFMAVDGVAPRAKMNQQRGRRFRSAKEAQTLETKAMERGEVLPTEARFDSNCITPGTVFMTRLNEQLKYFVVNKISNDKLWQNCKIILSGHETPGEGEHKIMDYIRYMRAQKGYDPNTRHCLYGLDADLIMLGLCTHEPHFSLLREEVKFGKKSNKRKNIPEQITFFLLHLSLMREYLELEFQPLKDSLKFDYDMEKIVDDWVLMGFLVGNDFIPNLPNMHITNGALPLLYNTYMKVLPTLDGYINEGGSLNLPRFEAFIQELGSIDVNSFSEQYADLKWFEGKTGRRLNDKFSKSPIKQRKLEVWEPEDDAILDEPLEPVKINSDLAALIKATDDMLLEPSATEQNHTVEIDDVEVACDSDKDSDATVTEEEDLFTAEFLQHKTDYYMNKLEYENVNAEVLRSQAEEYVRAIQWNLNYYYNGVCSWGWYYPHHYAPYVSDIKGFSDLKLHFDLGTPFKPYEQLLAVLPAASKSLLPVPFQELMVNADSIIKEYYPEDFKTDLNGKKQEWEAVVLIPFIEEDVLLKAMATCNNRLTAEENDRNCHGPMSVYEYTAEDLGEYEPPQYFPVITSSHAKCQHVAIEDIRVPQEKLVKGAYPGAKFDVYYPGFPTMKHLKYEGSLNKARVKVFEQPSKGENMILKIIEEEIPTGVEPPTADSISKELLGRTVHVGWPHLVEALVVSISTKEYRYHSAGEKGQYNVEENKGHLGSLWVSERQGMTEHYRNRLGVEVGMTDTLVHVKVMTGRKYMFSPRGRISLEKQWATVASAYPLQTVVRDISVYEENYVAYNDISSVFPVGSHCFMLGQPGYGVMAEVSDSSETLKEGRIKLVLTKIEEPDLTNVIEMENDIRIRFMNVHVAATKLAISKNLFSRITGSVFIAPGCRTQMAAEDAPKINIGLNLKFNKRNEEVPGYSRRDGTYWVYSDKAVALVGLYMRKFPEVFEYLNYNSKNDVFYEEEMFPEENAKVILREITTWIKQQPFYSVERQVCGSLVLDPEATQMLEKVIDEYQLQNCKGKQMIIKVRPHLLYKPDIQFGNLMPDPAATFFLYDRIVNVRQGYTVPLGYKGTIIGIHKPSSAKENETTYDVLFDQPFTGGLALNCSPNRGYRMPRPAIINISYGQRVMEQKTGKPGQYLSNSQGPQNHNGPRNNHSNPVGYSQNSGNFPNSNFQPQVPGFSNWSQGCNYPVRAPVPPVHNFNQYNYNNSPQSSYDGSYSRHVYNSGYASSPNFNNPGPNTFVPYKSNPFPRSPIISPQYGGSSASSTQKSVPSMNSKNSPAGSGDLRNFHQGHANGSDVSRSQRDEKREEGKTTILQKGQPVPKQEITILRKNNRMESAEDQFSKVNSEFLKKMLKIDESSNDSHASTNFKKSKQIETNKKENSTTLSVEDFFAHARIKEQQQQQTIAQTFYNTALLLKEYQTQKFGCPNYQYFEMNNDFMAKVGLPNGATVIGDPAASKDQAAENVATKALQMLKGGNNEPVNIRPPLDAVPEPPRRWQASQPPNQLSPKKNWPKPKEKVVTQENWRAEGGGGKQEKRERMIKVDQGQIHNHLNLKPVGVSYNSREKSTNSKPEVQKKQKSMTITNSTFVPLQAVRQHRNRTSSSSTSETLSKENLSSKQHAPKPEKVQIAQPEENAPTSKTPSKPRRERKMRIAANFQTAMSPQ